MQQKCSRKNLFVYLTPSPVNSLVLIYAASQILNPSFPRHQLRCGVCNHFVERPYQAHAVQAQDNENSIETYGSCQKLKLQLQKISVYIGATYAFRR